MEDSIVVKNNCCRPTSHDRTYWLCKKIFLSSPHLLRIFFFFCLPVLTSGQIFVCSFPGRSSNMTITFNDTVLIPGTTVFYSCDDGFTLVGEPARTCMYDGSWTGGSPVCAFNAAIDKPTNQSSTYKDAWHSYFAIDSSPNISCSGTTAEESPYWVLNLGRLYQVHMVKINPYGHVPLTNFDILVGNPDSFPKFQYCYHHNGKINNTSILCNKPIVGQFVKIEQHNPEPIYLVLCNVEILVSEESDCGGLNHIPNGFVQYLSNLTVEGSKAKYVCEQGYEIIGDSVRVCLENGYWNGVEPFCKKSDCGGLNHIPNGFVQYLSNLTVEGNKAKYVCEQGYEIIGNSVRVCLESGYWNGVEPFCKPIDCGSPPQVRHTSYHLENNLTSFKSLAQYHCEDSMKMTGDGILLCNDEAQWVGDTPECEDTSTAELFTDLAIKIGIGVGVAVVLILLILIIILLVVRRRQSSTTFRSEHNHENDLIKVKAYELVKTGDNAFYPQPAPRTNLKTNQALRKPDEPDLTENLLNSRDRDSRTFTKL